LFIDTVLGTTQASVISIVTVLFWAVATGFFTHKVFFIILVASALDIGSFGLNFSFQSNICHHAIQSSFTFIAYFVIQSELMSEKSLFAVLAVSIQAIFRSIAMASALEI
jgi:hypothetical protein